METNILTLDDLFSRDVQYTIPSFQRRYVWTEDDQWEPLWQDVKEAAAHQLDRLNGESHTGAAPKGSHFLGAVVLQKRPSRMKEPAKFDVIDGQQRLITLQVLLQTAAAVLQERGYDQARYLGVLVRNRELYPDHLLKVLPTVHDRVGFEAAMELHGSGGGANSGIVKAARYFRDSLRDWLAEADSSAEQDTAAQRAEALVAILQAHLNLVVIETDGTDGQDDANMIFETLNARGTPLLAWDLTKNHILNAAPRDAALDLSRFDSDWWQSEVGRGRQRRTHVDRYLISWLTMRSQQHVRDRTARTVFDDFRSYAAGNGSEVSFTAIAKDLIRVSDSYRDIWELDNASALGRFLRRWRTLPAGAFEPVVLWLCAELDRDDPVQSQQQQRAATVLESYFVRRMLCGVSHQGAGGRDLVSSAVSLLGKLHTEGPRRAGDCLLEHFSPYFDPDQRLFWPDDERVRQSLKTRLPFYGRLTVERARMVLSAIEAELRGSGAEQGVPGTVSIEHIMPRSWSAQDWPFRGGRQPDDPAVNERRGFLLQTIGNLTLVTTKLNARLSNSPWAQKRAHLESSVLQINRDLLHHAPPDHWDEESIEERSEHLAAICNQIWPEPQRIL